MYRKDYVYSLLATLNLVDRSFIYSIVLDKLAEKSSGDKSMHRKNEKRFATGVLLTPTFIMFSSILLHVLGNYLLLLRRRIYFYDFTAYKALIGYGIG